MTGAIDFVYSMAFLSCMEVVFLEHLSAHTIPPGLFSIPCRYFHSFLFRVWAHSTHLHSPPSTEDLTSSDSWRRFSINYRFRPWLTLLTEYVCGNNELLLKPPTIANFWTHMSFDSDEESTQISFDSDEDSMQMSSDNDEDSMQMSSDLNDEDVSDAEPANSYPKCSDDEARLCVDTLI